MNKPLFIFDILVLPITIMRMIIIYFYGSRYEIGGFEFLDIMNHSEKKYFNQEDDNPKVDLINRDMRECIYESSKLYIESLDPQIIVKENIQETKQNKQSDDDNNNNNDNNGVEEDRMKYINLLSMILESEADNILNTEFTENREESYYEEENNNTEMIDLDEDIIFIKKQN